MLDTERLISSTRPDKLVGVDIESTLIKDDNDIDKFWSIAWSYPNGKEYCLSFPEGITKEDLSREFLNCESYLALSPKSTKHSLLTEIRNLLIGATDYVPVFHNASFDKRHLEDVGLDIPLYHDSMVMAYNLFPPTVLGATGEDDSIRFYSLAALGDMGICSTKIEWDNGFDSFHEDIPDYNKRDATACREVAEFCLSNFRKNQDKSWDSYLIDLCTQEVLMEAHRVGVGIDGEEVSRLALEYEERLSEVEKELKRQIPALTTDKTVALKRIPSNLVPCSPNQIYSYAQVGKYTLYSAKDGEYLCKSIKAYSPSSNDHNAVALKANGWRPSKLSRKTNKPSVGNAAIEEFSHVSDFANKLLKYRMYKKLLSTYLLPYKKAINTRMYPSFLVCGTRTGRLSSRSPNFQNVPGDAEIRKLIVPRPGNKLVCIDLSQIELRVLAWYMAQAIPTDEGRYLWNLYCSDSDVHEYNAKMMGCERKLAKIGVFLYIYGGKIARFAASLKISMNEAKKYYNNLEVNVPALPAIRNLIYELARTKRVLRTMYGHKIVYPELFAASSPYQQEASLRQYFNACIQGTQADIIKLLMWKSREIMTRKLGYLILQVHDELLFEVPEGNVKQVMEILYREFNNDYLLPGLPVKGMPGVGDNWYEAKQDGDRRDKEEKAKGLNKYESNRL